ncbi:MAG: DMT family transporter [Parvibaculaceae bacterium]
MASIGEASSTARGDNRLFAIASIVAGVGLSSGMDATNKWLSGDYPFHQLLVMRAAVALPILFGVLLVRRLPARLPISIWPLVLTRGLILASGYVAFTLSIAAMPMANSVAIYFTMPLIVAALAGPMLGERVPGYRWLAIILGFAGVMVMVRPGSGVFEPAALIALYAALAYGTGQLFTRRIGLRAEPSALAFHQNTIYLAVGLALGLVFGWGGLTSDIHPSIAFLTRGWVTPTGSDLCLMIGVGFLSAVAMLLFTQAYRSAEANLVAPFEYTAMFWAVLFGLVVFGDVPGLSTILGGGLVIFAGFYMLLNDRRRR